MGILNVTPDSFFDGGFHFHLDEAIEHGLSMAREGADIIDVGGESTRPFSDPLPLEEELRRVVSERRARVQELGFREEIFRTKLEFYEKQFDSGRISESTFQDLKSELEAEIEEVANRIRMQEEDISTESDST